MLRIVEEKVTGSEYTLHADVNGEAAGKLVYELFVFDAKTAVIADLEVVKKFQRKGIATELIDVAIDQIFKRQYVKRILIQDGSEGNITQRIVTKLGFEKEGHFYSLTRQARSLVVKHSADNRKTVGSIPTEPKI